MSETSRTKSQMLSGNPAPASKQLSRTKSSSKVQGWERLDALARKPTILALQDGRLLEVTRTRAYLLRAQRVPDGVYDLQRAGKLVVRNGVLSEIVGAPFAEAIYSTLP